MLQKEANVLILRPTNVFLTFLETEFPEIVTLPSIEALQQNNTAYTLLKKDSDEETLDEIEKHFKTMFRYEIRKILGSKFRYDIEASFLDFLCCFKFELHSEIILMDADFVSNQNLLCFKPRSVLLKWIKSSLDYRDDALPVVEQVTLTHLAENATVVIKKFEHNEDIKSFIEHYYYAIYTAEMLRMADETDKWPMIDSFETFSNYFSVEVHSHLVHLS
jgi:hypothetical protein